MKMPEHCSHCGQRYNLEPSFWMGAMFVSYALQVGLLVSVYVALYVFFDPSVEIYISSLLLVIVLLTPAIFRISRAMYINIFVRYRKGE